MSTRMTFGRARNVVDQNVHPTSIQISCLHLLVRVAVIRARLQ